MEKGHLQITDWIFLLKKVFSESALLENSGINYDRDRKTLSRLSQGKDIDQESIEWFWNTLTDLLSSIFESSRHNQSNSIVENIQLSYQDMSCILFPFGISKSQSRLFYVHYFFINFLAIRIRKLSEQDNSDEVLSEIPYWFLWDYSDNNVVSPMKKSFEYLQRKLGFSSIYKLAEGLSSFKILSDFTEEVATKISKWSKEEISPQWGSIKAIIDFDFKKINETISDEDTKEIKMSLGVSYFMHNLKAYLCDEIGHSDWKKINNSYICLLDSLFERKNEFLISDVDVQLCNYSLQILAAISGLNDSIPNDLFQGWLLDLGNVSNETSEYFSNIEVHLRTHLNSKTPKSVEDGNYAEQLLNSLESIKEPQFQFLYLFYKGRYSLFHGESELALTHYRNAYALRSFAGNYSKTLLEEFVLILLIQGSCSQVELKKAYKWGKAIGLIEQSFTDYEYFLKDRRKSLFLTHFPKDCFFNSEKADKLLAQLENHDGHRFIDLEKVERHLSNIDKRNINRKVRYDSMLITPLCLAVPREDPEMVRMYLDMGADPGMLLEDNTSALLLAIQILESRRLHSRNSSKIEAIIELLLDRDIIPEINASSKIKNISPLSAAVDCCNLDLVKRLIEKGADPNRRQGADDLTALYQALGLLSRATQVENGLNEMMIPTLDPTKSHRITIPGIEHFYSEEKGDSIGKIFLRRSRDKNFQDALEHTGLTFSRMYSKSLDEIKAICLYLITKKPDLQYRGNNGFTPYLFSCEVGDYDIFLKLHEMTEDRLVTNDQNGTSIMIASACGHYQIMQTILKDGISPVINNQNKGGLNTALHFFLVMVQKKQCPIETELFKLFVENNADLNIRNIEGKSAKEILLNQEKYELLALTDGFKI